MNQRLFGKLHGFKKSKWLNSSIWLVDSYGISNLVGYLMPNPVYTLLYTVPMNINGYVPIFINTLDTIVKGR